MRNIFPSIIITHRVLVKDFQVLGNILIKGAGPVVSLIIGIIFHFICSRQVQRNALFLFNVYMSLNGYISFWGYLIIAYLVPGGDTGYVCSVLGFPAWLTILLGFAGAVALYFTINSLMKYFVSMGSKEIIENEKDRKEFIRFLILFPLFNLSCDNYFTQFASANSSKYDCSYLWSSYHSLWL